MTLVLIVATGLCSCGSGADGANALGDSPIVDPEHADSSPTGRVAIIGEWVGDLELGNESIETHVEIRDTDFGLQGQISLMDLGRRYAVALTNSDSVRFALQSARFGYLEFAAAARTVGEPGGAPDPDHLIGRVGGARDGSFNLRRVDDDCAACDAVVGKYVNGADTLLLQHRPYGGLTVVIFGEGLAIGARFSVGGEVVRLDAEGEITETIGLDRDPRGSVVSVTRRSLTEESVWTRLVDVYHQREVTWESDGLLLTGTVYEPVDVPLIAAIATVQGSLGGAYTTRENFWHIDLADRLASEGVMVLVPDKRGSGDSDGDWTIGSIEDLAEDAIGSARVLRDLAPSWIPIGLLGLSEGGRIVAQVGREPGPVDFVVNVSGGTVDPAETSLWEMENIALDLGLEGPMLERALGLQATALQFTQTRTVADFKAYLDLRNELLSDPVLEDYARPFPMDMGHPRIRQAIRSNGFRPMDHWPQVEIPVLALFGLEDPKTLAQASFDQLIANFAGVNQSPLNQAHLFDGLGHGMQDPTTGGFSQLFLDQVLQWLVRVSQNTPG